MAQQRAAVVRFPSGQPLPVSRGHRRRTLHQCEVERSCQRCLAAPGQPCTSLRDPGALVEPHYLRKLDPPAKTGTYRDENGILVHRAPVLWSFEPYDENDGSAHAFPLPSGIGRGGF